MFTFEDLLGLCRGRTGASDCPCPACGPSRRLPENRKRRVLRVWLEDGFATYNCARCGAHGYAHGDGGHRHHRRAHVHVDRNRDCVGKRDLGRRIWGESLAVESTLAERYLVRTRGLSPRSPWPLALRFHAGMPAMVAAVSGADRKILAVQITSLDPRTAGKAQISQPRRTYGRMEDGALRLAPAGDELALAEGVETALSFTELTGVVCWAVLGKSRFAKIAIPAWVRRLHLAADVDAIEICEKAKLVYERRGLEVRMHVPELGNDFNDALLERRRAA